MKILIGADFVPTKSNEEYFASGKVEGILDKGLEQILIESDFSVFNLEMPMTDISSPIEKTGPALKTGSMSVGGYKKLNVSLLTLANNHILDHGGQGLSDTIQTLDKNGIQHIGAGNNIYEASRSKVYNIEGHRIGVYACVEHEFTVATTEKPGANPFDPLESYDSVQALKDECDYLIVLYHGGKEHYRYPSPNLQKYCRKFIEKGANLVVCQHSHCIGCEEKYKSGTIVYGQGNFLFDYQDNEYWKSGLLIEIVDERIKYIPVVKNGCAVRIADNDETKKILDEFTERSNQIKNPGFVEKQYLEFAKSKREYYLEALNGVNKRSVFYRVMNRITNGRYKTNRINKIYRRDRIVVIRNFTECEAHIELLLKSIE